MIKNLEDSIKKTQLEYDVLKEMAVTRERTNKLLLIKEELENYKKEYRILTGEDYVYKKDGEK